MIQRMIICIGVDPVLAGNGHVDLGVVIQIKATGGDVKIAFQHAAAHGSAAPVGVHEEGSGYIAYHGVGATDHGIQGICVVGFGHRHGLSQNGVIKIETVCQTLIGIPGHPTAPQIHFVHQIRQGIEAENFVFLLVSHPHQHVLIDGCFHVHQTGQVLYLLHLIVGPAVGAEEPQVEGVLLVCKDLTCLHHVDLGHPQAGENGTAQGDDQHDGQISSEGAADGLGQVFDHHILFHYHSIS